MFQTIRNYVQTCTTCQQRGNQQVNEQLRPLRVGQPFERIGIDLVGPLPRTAQGNRYIIVAMDYLTKWPEAKAIPDASAKEAAQFIHEDIICRHGCPRELLSDRGTTFLNETIRQLCLNHGIKHRLSSPYHPQINGLVECFNRTLCQSLAKYVDLVQHD